jgi:hypothetical protein
VTARTIRARTADGEQHGFVPHARQQQDQEAVDEARDTTRPCASRPS